MNDSPAQPEHAQPERLEQIVAYLDGELPPGESAEVERRLAADERFRQELQSMERAWTALDELPRATVSDKFSQTTMELAVSAARQEVSQKSGAFRRKPRTLSALMFLLGAACVLLGFVAARQLTSDPNRQLLAALPVIRNVDLYTQLKGSADDEIRFLSLLAPHRASLAAPAVQSEINTRLQSPVDLQTHDQRRAWLRALPDDQRTTLLYKARRFRDLPAAERARMTELHEAIAGDAQADELRATLECYGHWLANLPQGQQFELRQMPHDERVRQVRLLIQQHGNDQRFALNEEQLRRLAQAFAKTRNEAAGMFADLERTGRNHAARAERLRMLSRLRTELEAGEGPRARVYQMIQEALPDEVRAEFEKLSLSEQLLQLRNWQRQIRGQAGKVSQQELERFFAEELDASLREELLRLSPEDMRQRLQRLYHRLPYGGEVQGFGPPRELRPFDGRRGDRDRPRGFGPPDPRRFGPGPPPEERPAGR